MTFPFSKIIVICPKVIVTCPTKLLQSATYAGAGAPGQGRRDRYAPLSKFIARKLPLYLETLKPQLYLFEQ